VALLARLEAVQWWRQFIPRRDFCAAWDGAGLAWVEVRTAAATVTTRAAAGGKAGGEEAGERTYWVRGWID
jgi:hypothetical protein